MNFTTKGTKNTKVRDEKVIQRRSNEQAEKKWWRKPVVVVPLGMVVLGVIGVVGLRMAAARGLEREMAAIRARGLPTSPEELNAWYVAVPAEENLALRVLAACDRYVAPSSRLDPLKYSLRDTPDGEALSAEVAEAARDYVKRNFLALAEVQRGAGLNRSRYPVDLSAEVSLGRPPAEG